MLRAVAVLAVSGAVGGAIVAQAPASSHGSRALAASTPNLGPHQTPCPPRATNCCPGADCNAHPDLAPASPYLIETAIGREDISSHVIHVGHRFTISFHSNVTDPKGWTFPDIAKKISRCETGVDLQCTYLARSSDVTYPEFATYNGWTDYDFGVGNSRGLGTGTGYYAIIGPRVALSGRLADKHGKAIPAGGIPTPPGTPTPDAGVLIFIYVKHHGALRLVTDVGPRLHSSRAHPYDVGYYGLVLKPGTYTVAAGDPIEHVSCARRTVHLTHNTANFNFRCKRG